MRGLGFRLYFDCQLQCVQSGNLGFRDTGLGFYRGFYRGTIVGLITGDTSRARRVYECILATPPPHTLDPELSRDYNLKL